METNVYIAIGSNLGDRELNILRAVAELGKLRDSRVTALSSFYETSPVGMSADTPPFYNAVARLSTLLSPENLLSELQRIESSVFGRSQTRSVESRRMDLDILLYGEMLIDTPELTIPHPRMFHRKFVLIPLTEIAPELADPVSGMTVQEILEAIKSDESVVKLEN